MKLRYFLEYLDAFRVLGIKTSLFELLRRLFNISYTVDGLEIRSNSQYYSLYVLAKLGWRVEEVGADITVLMNDRLGLKIAGPKDIKYFGILERYPLSIHEYGLTYKQINNKNILDIGSYLGETVVDFTTMGAKYVEGYEPVFFRYCQKTILLNEISKNAKCNSHGVFWDTGTIELAEQSTGSGLNLGDLKISTIDFEEILRAKKWDIAKVDCEGCEYSLLSVPDEIISKVPLWIVEIHGAPLPLVYKFKRAGFNMGVLKSINGGLISVWRFTKDNNFG